MRYFLPLLLMPCLVGYVNPTDGQPHASAILRAYDPPPKPWLPGHRGVNLPATPGTPILAAEDGIVAFAGDVAGTPVVSIDHPDGIRTTYQPVHAWVAQGEHVNEGTVIGILGSPPANDPGLHWGARTDRDTYLNPLSLLDTPTIRLKPV